MAWRKNLFGLVAVDESIPTATTADQVGCVHVTVFHDKNSIVLNIERTVVLLLLGKSRARSHKGIQECQGQADSLREVL